MRDGTIVKRDKWDKDGGLIGYEIVAHPSLLALPKLMADLGITPSEMMITPKALLKDQNEKESIKSAADIMSRLGRACRPDDKDEE